MLPTNTYEKFFDKRILESITSFAFLQGLNYIFPLIIIPLLTSRLGLTSYGNVIFHQTICAQILIFSEWGFLWSSTKDIASNSNDSEIISKIFRQTIHSQLVLSLTILILLLFCIIIFRIDSLIILEYYGLMLIGNIFLVQWYFQGRESMRYVVFANTFSKAFSLLLIYNYVNTSTDDHICLMILACSSALTGFIVFLIAIKDLDHLYLYRFSFIEVLNLLKDTRSLFIARFVSSISSNSPTLLLGLISGRESVAVFSLADKIRIAAQSLIGPITQSVSIRMNRIFKDNLISFMETVKFGLLFTIAGSSLICIATIYCSEQIILFLSTGSYIDASTVLKIISPLIIIVNISNIIGGQLFIPSGQYRYYSKAILYSAIVSTPVIAILIFFLDEYGASYGMVFSETAVLLALLYYCKVCNLLPINQKISK